MSSDGEKKAIPKPKAPPLVPGGRMERQEVANVRALIPRIIAELGLPGDFELNEQDVRLIAHLRAVGYGTVEIQVVKGYPAKATKTTETVDYTKPISFEG